MTPEESTKIILEMLQVAGQRGAFSSIEVKAINEAIAVIQTPPIENDKIG